MTKKKTQVDLNETIEAPISRPWEEHYLTIDEWVDKFSVSLKCHLKESVWPRSADEKHHPEDLASNSGAFLDALTHILPEFGAHNK